MAEFLKLDPDTSLQRISAARGRSRNCSLHTMSFKGNLDLRLEIILPMQRHLSAATHPIHDTWDEACGERRQRRRKLMH